MSVPEDLSSPPPTAGPAGTQATSLHPPPDFPYAPPGIPYAPAGLDETVPLLKKRFDTVDVTFISALCLLIGAFVGTAIWTSLPSWARDFLLPSSEGVKRPWPPYAAPSLGAAIAALIIGASVVYWLSWKGKRADAERERAALETAADRLREKMELPSLADYNQALLDRYHKLATDQADKAYRSSRFAMGLCLAILLAAFCIGWRLNAQGDRLFIGSAAAVGATFTAYLSRTYMQTYERSLQQLNQYFNHPVLNGYFLTAERIAAGLPEDRRHAVSEKIVSEVLESGKEMHHIVTNASVPQTSAPKPGRRRRVPKQEASIPAQQNP